MSIRRKLDPGRCRGNSNENGTRSGPTLNTMDPMIEVEELEVRFDGEIALAGVDLEVPAGTSLAIIGPNGSGKSTLLRAIASTIETSSGSVRAPDSAFVLQSTVVDRSLPITVRETVSLARYARVGPLRAFSDDDRRAVDDALERLAITDLAGRQLHDLSGGQRQRVLVAQGLAQQAPLLLLDEPVTGLDVVSRAIILDVIDEEVANGRTVVLTTHDLDDARRCDAVLLLDTTPVALGCPAEVLTPTNLSKAYGGRFFVADSGILLDDPHHDH